MSRRAVPAHSRLVRRSRWRVAVLGALVVTAILAALSTAAYFAARGAIYGRLQERLEHAARAAETQSGATGSATAGEAEAAGSGSAASITVLHPPEDGPETVRRFHIVPDAAAGALAVLRLPTAGTSLATPAGDQVDALADFLRLLAAMTIVGGLLAVPAGYVLAGRALRPLDQALRERNEFVARASHQLRTPLSTIRTSAELARAGRGVDAADALATILSQTERMEALSARLAALARAGRGEPAPPPTNLDDVVRQVATSLGPSAEQAGVSLAVEVPAGLRAQADPADLADVLAAVAENAIKFSPRGGTVGMRAWQEGRRAVIEVVDAGPGIAAADLPHVHEPFYQGRDARGGQGLGLAIAQASVRRNHGTLQIRSVPGGGTRVQVRLAAAREAPS